MSEQRTKFTPPHHLSPPLAPKDVRDVLRDADVLLDLMGREALPLVAEHAEILMTCAHDVGASEIEAAAGALRRVASSHRPVVLTEAMRALTEAISHTEKKLAA
jgi:hypothetical protein